MPDDPSPEAQSTVALLRTIGWVVSVPVVRKGICAVDVAVDAPVASLATAFIHTLRRHGRVRVWRRSKGVEPMMPDEASHVR
jgi:hypothetical protein